MEKCELYLNKTLSIFQVIKHLRYSSISVPPLYGENFRKAMWAFQHQRVYDPTGEEIVHLSDIPSDIGEDLDFLGPYPFILFKVFLKLVATCKYLHGLL